MLSGPLARPRQKLSFPRLRLRHDGRSDGLPWPCYRPWVLDRYKPPLAVWALIGPRIGARGPGGAARQVEYVDPSVPDGLALVRFMDWYRLDKRGLAAVLRFDGQL